VPEKHGIWIKSCGKQYLFGNKIVTNCLRSCKSIPTIVFKVNWTRNVEKCCSLGMDPIIFNSAEEQLCLGSIIQSTPSTNISQISK
jgi:hypothetical protein